MRRHGIAAPERKRNSVASASVSITKTTSTEPACTHEVRPDGFLGQAEQRREPAEERRRRHGQDGRER